jgi:two-component system sensor histidine kinase KdpD
MPLKSSTIGVGAVGLMTAALLVVNSHVTHPLEHLAFGYMLPIAAVAMLFGSAAGTVAVAVSALAAAFFFFPPTFSFWIDEPIHIAELFWLTVLGYVASKAAGGLTLASGSRIAVPESAVERAMRWLRRRMPKQT